MMEPEDDDFRSALDIDGLEDEEGFFDGPSAPKKLKGGRPSSDVWSLLLGETPAKALDKKSVKCVHSPHVVPNMQVLTFFQLLEMTKMGFWEINNFNQRQRVMHVNKK